MGSFEGKLSFWIIINMKSLSVAVLFGALVSLALVGSSNAAVAEKLMDRWGSPPECDPCWKAANEYKDNCIKEQNLGLFDIKARIACKADGMELAMERNQMVCSNCLCLSAMVL